MRMGAWSRWHVCYGSRLSIHPPSIVRVDPVTCLASSLQRYTTIEPTCSVCVCGDGVCVCVCGDGVR